MHGSEQQGWTRVAATSARLSALADPVEICAATLDAALALTGADAAALVNLAGPASLDRITAIGTRADELVTAIDRPAGSAATGVIATWRAQLHAHSETLGFVVLGGSEGWSPAAIAAIQLDVVVGAAAAALRSARYHEQLAELARRDPLTGLGHTRSCSERVDELMVGRARHAVLSIDIDRFHLVNEVLGREAGDAALHTLATAMNAALRMDDCLFRTGGDEFAVVVPVRDEADAMRIAERIQRAAQRSGHPVSIGIAVAEPGSDDRPGLFRRADAALAGVKRRGCSGTALSHSPPAVQVARSEVPARG